jgi:hypothetical protein
MIEKVWLVQNSFWLRLILLLEGAGDAVDGPLALDELVRG